MMNPCMHRIQIQVLCYWCIGVGAGPAGLDLAEPLFQRFNYKYNYVKIVRAYFSRTTSPSYAPMVAMDNQVSHYLFDRVPQCCIIIGTFL